MMEIRRKEYMEIGELLSGLYNTATSEEKESVKEELPKSYRKLQSWASDEVLKKLVELINALDKASGTGQGISDIKHKELIVAMRKDLLGKTKLEPKDIYVLGKIN